MEEIGQSGWISLILGQEQAPDTLPSRTVPLSALLSRGKRYDTRVENDAQYFAVINGASARSSALQYAVNQPGLCPTIQYHHLSKLIDDPENLLSDLATQSLGISTPTPTS